jgi:acetyl/propionyl-CoA carboxylase alpha subunit
MNTRLQVEHPVTEEVWGVDLAAAMIAIALGGSPSFDPSAAAPRGHAIECRVYAEDPRRGFAPAPGRIDVLRLPQGPGVRHDMGIEEGSVVPIDYDPMLGKLVVHGADRRQAIARLSRALAEYEIGGVETTLPLFRALAADPGFAAAEFDVQWLERRLAEGLLAAREASDAQVLLAAAALPGLGGAQTARAESRPPAAARSGSRRRAASRCGTDEAATMRRYRFVHRTAAGAEEIAVERDGTRCTVTRDGRAAAGHLRELPDGRVSLLLDDGRQLCGRVRAASEGAVEVFASGALARISLADPLHDRLAHAAAEAGEGSGEEEIRALMPGRVLESPCRPETRSRQAHCCSSSRR